MKEMMKRTLALLLALSLLLGCIALAEEEEEELSIADLLEAQEADDSDWEAEVENLFFMDESVQADLDQLDQDIELDTSIDPDTLELNHNLPDNVVNILLIGIDTRSDAVTSEVKDNVRGDVMMILSVNTETGSVKLTSLLRDSYVEIPGYKNKSKLNVAYQRGGGQLAMRTVNHNFEMNVQYYVTINFFGLASIIDGIGGIDVDLTKVEAGAINAYLRKHPPKYDNTDGKSRVPLEKKAGIQHLDGVQAVMYARLREIDNDFKRTERQRHLLELLLKEVMKDMSIGKLLDLVDTTMPYVTCNLNASSIFNLAMGVLQSDIISRAQSGLPLLEQHRIPMDKTYGYKTVNGSSVVNISATNMRTNIEALHQFIYGAYYPAK